MTNSDLHGEQKRKGLRFQKELSIADGFFMIIGTFVLLNLLLATGLFPAVKIAEWLPGGADAINLLLVQQGLQAIVMLGLLLLFLYGLRGGTLRQIGLRPLQNRRWLLIAAVSGVAMFFAMTLLSALLAALFPQWMEPQSITVQIMQAETVWNKIAVCLAVCVFAPVSEELLFRGYIYHSLRSHYPVLFSMLITALLFGCMHYDLIRLLPLTLAGVGLNWIAVRANSLWASILMHGTWNFMTLLSVLFLE